MLATSENFHEKPQHNRSRTWTWANNPLTPPATTTAASKVDDVLGGGQRERGGFRRRCGSVDTPTIVSTFDESSTLSSNSTWSRRRRPRESTNIPLVRTEIAFKPTSHLSGSPTIRPPKLIDENRCSTSHAPPPSQRPSTVVVPLCRHVYSHTSDFVSVALRQWWWGVPALSAILLVPGTLLFLPVLYVYQPCCNLWQRWKRSTRPPASLKVETQFLIQWVLGHWQAFASAQQRRLYLLLAAVSAKWFHGHYLRQRNRRAKQEHHRHH